MAINRTNVGRQMVGDLGNFVGKDLRKQFMYGPQKLAYGPQKLAEGDSVAEEIAFETVSFTDDITGETKTFQFNPETHHPPDSTGRMRKKGVGSSDVARVGGVDFFDKAELVEQPAAPAGPAAPPKQKPLPPPINQETGADEDERREQRDQLFNPLQHSYASPKGALMDYKISKYVDPIVRIASRGMINPDIDDRLRRYMGEKPDRYVRSYEGRPEDYGKRVLDPRDKTLGLDKKTIDKELAEQRKFSGLKDDERFKDDQVKDLLWRARERNLNPMWRRQIEKGGMKTSDSGDPVEKSSDTSDKPSDTSGSLSDIVTQLEGPESTKDVGLSAIVTQLEGPESTKTVGEEIVYKPPQPAPSPARIKSEAEKEADASRKEAGILTKEEVDQKQKEMDEKLKGSLLNQITQQAARPKTPGEKAGISTETAGPVPESVWGKGFDGLTFGSEEAYLDTIQSEIMRRLDEEEKEDIFRRAQGQVSRGQGELAGQIIAQASEDQPDAPSGWDETVDYGSPFRQGGPVRFARGGGLSSLKPPINPGDFVIASDVVSGIGDGSSQFGVERLTEELGVQPRPFSAALGGEVRGPGSGLDDLIQTTVRGKQAARLANQEFLVPRQDVMKIGKGSLKNGQEMLYALMDRVRKQKSGGQQPPRLQGSLAGLMGNMRS